MLPNSRRREFEIIHSLDINIFGEAQFMSLNIPSSLLFHPKLLLCIRLHFFYTSSVFHSHLLFNPLLPILSHFPPLLNFLYILSPPDSSSHVSPSDGLFFFYTSSVFHSLISLSYPSPYLPLNSTFPLTIKEISLPIIIFPTFLLILPPFSCLFSLFSFLLLPTIYRPSLSFLFLSPCTS